MKLVVAWFGGAFCGAMVALTYAERRFSEHRRELRAEVDRYLATLSERSKP